MTSEVWIENYRLDISNEISSLITFELDNIRNFAERGTSWSKTIVLPGTANNNKLFGHIFQIGQSNVHNPDANNVGYNFNASKSARALIFQDQFQTFKGVLRLMQINITNGKPEYEVAVFGELAGLNVSLSSGKLEDLDFSAYDHPYNETNIVASWDAAPGTGYFYPLIDYGQVSVDKHDWDIRAFRPALFVREYIDKMFTDAGYRWSSALFNTDRFKRLVIPQNKKLLSKLQRTDLLDTSITSSQSGVSEIEFDVITSTHFNLSVFNRHINYAFATPISGDMRLRIGGSFRDRDITISLFKNGVSIFNQSYVFSGTFANFFSIDQTLHQSFVNGDVYRVIITWTDTGGLPGHTISNAQVTVLSDDLIDSPIAYNTALEVNQMIPKNIRQIDFLVSIVKLFNLYVYEDRFDSRLIYITPYVDFYSTSSLDSVDWTYKLNRDKAIKIKPMSELNAKIYSFKYKPDSDYYGELYRRRYNEGYGDYKFDSEFEFSAQEKSLELIFSATALVGYNLEDKVISTLFKKSNDIEESIDTNIRILQTKKVTGVSNWNMLDGPSTILVNLDKYGYGGHLDDPDAPSNDLNFGALRELFFVLVSGNLSATQFNVYWSAYMAEITDKDSKLVSAWFYLKPVDILQLDFSKKIFIDGVLFRLNSVRDYNVTKPSDCAVELLKVNYLIY